MRSAWRGLPWMLGGVLLSAPAFATSFDGVAFPSTPFMPPQGFLWVPLVFILLFGLVNGFLLRWLVANERKMAFSMAFIIGALTLGAGIIFSRGFYFSQIQDSTWGSKVYWGWDWAKSCDEFLAINALSLLPMLAGACFLSFYGEEHHPDAQRPWHTVFVVGLLAYLILPMFLDPQAPNLLINIAGPSALLIAGLLKGMQRFGNKSLLLIGANIALYLITLLPFIFTGAYMHGSPPYMTCQRYLTWNYGGALLAYTREHHGRLPKASSLDELLTQLRPIGEEGFFWMEGEDPVMCPAADWLDRHPKSYRWNPQAAGKTIDELRKLPHPVNIITCPYHRYRYIDSTALIKAYDDPEIHYVEIDHW